MKYLITLTLTLAVAIATQAQKSQIEPNELPTYPALPAVLLVAPPAHYLQWKCDTSNEDQTLFFTEYAPSYTYHVLSEKYHGYDSAAIVLVSCHNYGYSSTPTQELETALRLFKSVVWESIEYHVPIKGSLKQQHRRNASLPENTPLISAIKGDRLVDLTVFFFENEPHYQIFSYAQQ
jgi:hypothetical protein